MLLSVKEASQRLAVSRGCIYELIASGKLAHARIGCGRGTIRIPEEAVEEYLEAAIQASSPRVAKKRRGRALFSHLDADRLSGGRN